MRHQHRACCRRAGTVPARSSGAGVEFVLRKDPDAKRRVAAERARQMQEFATRLKDQVNAVTAVSPLARSIVQLFADRLGARSAPSLGEAYWAGLASTIDAEGNLQPGNTDFMFIVGVDDFVPNSSPPTSYVWFSYPAFQLSDEDVGVMAVHEVVHACSSSGPTAGSRMEEVFCYFTEAVVLEQWRGTPLDVEAQSQRIRGYLSQSLYDDFVMSTPDELVTHLELNGVRQVYDSASWDRIIGYVRGYTP